MRRALQGGQPATVFRHCRGKYEDAMAFIPVPGVVEAELVYEQFGQIVENTLYFQYAAPADAGVLTDLCNYLIGWWTEQMASNINQVVTLLRVVATALDSDSAPSISITAPPDTSGEDTSEALPGNASWTISFHTAGRGRSSRGRNYVPGLSADGTSGNQVTSGFAANVRTAYENILTGAGAPDALHVVVSRYHNNAPRAEGLAVQVTSYVITDLNIDSQRRRLNGRGT